MHDAHNRKNPGVFGRTLIRILIVIFGFLLLMNFFEKRIGEIGVILAGVVFIAMFYLISGWVFKED